MSAVVFLILGIALLGGGLLFIRSLMAKSEAGVAAIMKSGDIGKKADTYNPLIVDREITIKATETKAIVISFYCNKPSGEVCGGATSSTDLARPFFAEDTTGTTGKCSGLDQDGKSITLQISSTGTANPGISMSSLATNVNAHQNVGFRVILNSKDAKAGKYNCNIIVAKSGSLGNFIALPPDGGGEVYETRQIFINVI